MKTLRLPTIYLLAFTICCLLFKCKRNSEATPQVVTTLHGVVKDVNTGTFYAGVKLQIVKRTTASSFSGGYNYDYYDTVLTKADGSYSLTFKTSVNKNYPSGDGTYFLFIDNPDKYNFSHYATLLNPASADANAGSITLGGDITRDFPMTTLINLKVHLINNSNQKRTNFDLYVDGCCGEAYGLTDIYHMVKADTLFNYKVPQFGRVNLLSRYYSGYTNKGDRNDTLTFRKYFTCGKNDTTVTVTNP